LEAREATMLGLVRKMTLIKAAGICVIVAFLFASEFAEARSSMLCKVSLGGAGMIRGYVLVTLSNLTKSTIPNGQTLFAKKGDQTLQFQTETPIGENGSVSFETRDKAFMVPGDCEGWID
jgi:hypothetical protein